MPLGERLREERERIGLSQVDFAALAGATKQTLFSWESGKSSPKAEQMALLANHGVDVYYVITGVRIGAVTVLTAREAELVNNYRSADEAQKLALETTSSAFAKPGNADRGQKSDGDQMTFHGEVGQVVKAQTVSQTGFSFGRKK